MKAIQSIGIIHLWQNIPGLQ